MNVFNLPDLGEGLPDAEIYEWFIKEGDKVSIDQPLVSMETAKALVEVPSPQDGVVTKLFGKPKDIIKTGMPLVEFATQDNTQTHNLAADKGTVVGVLETRADTSIDTFTINTKTSTLRENCTSSVKFLAEKLNVNLKDVHGSGVNGLITREDILQAKNLESLKINTNGFEALHGLKRAMVHSMMESHQNVVPVTIFDEADIHAWESNTDITVRLIRAIQNAANKEPSLNAWFHTKECALKSFNEVNLGIAMDTSWGLFVPVIRDIKRFSDNQLRQIINDYKLQVNNRSIPIEDLKGSTFVLSNFGNFAGRFATPIIIPPTVGILAVGRMHRTPVVDNNKIEAHRLLPLSLSFDHRAVTGGEAARFLGQVIESLKQS